MTELSQAAPTDPFIRAAGAFAIVSGVISAIGVILLVGMFVMFMSNRQPLGLTLGLLNDICVAVQYLLTIPIAFALYRILSPYNPTLIRIATIIGVVSMLIVIGLQLALIFVAMSFERQVIWVSLAMIVGVGSWLVITGLVSRETGKLPNSLLMSGLAVPYVGYPVWAFWLGLRLLAW